MESVIPLTGRPQERPLQNMSVRVDDLTVRFPERYGEVAVLDGISLTLERGETLGVVGESGSGKTLLGLAILGLLPPAAVSEGRVTVEGTEMIGATPRQLSQVRGGVVTAVFQDALVALSPTRTLGNHFRDVWISAGLPARDWRTRAEETLELAALREPDRVLASYPHQLSGGMRQRAMIALALMRKPSVLIADEPTTALDRVVELEVLETLTRLQKNLGLTMMLISHDLSVVEKMAARIAVLYGGQLCELGPTSAVVTEPLHRYSEGLLAAVASLDKRRRPLAAIQGVVPSPSQFETGCRFYGRCPYGSEDCRNERPHVRVDDRSAWCHHPATSVASQRRGQRWREQSE